MLNLFKMSDTTSLKKELQPSIIVSNNYQTKELSVLRNYLVDLMLVDTLIADP